MEKFMNIKKNNLFKKDFNYPLFSRVRIKADTTFFFVLERRTFLFNKKTSLMLDTKHKLVEPRGLEPLSKNNFPKSSTSLVR